MTIKVLITYLSILLSTCMACTHPPIPQRIVKSINNEPLKKHTVGPATQVVKTIYVDKRFTEEERAAIRDAGDIWETLTNGLVKFVFEWEYVVDLDTLSHKIVIVDLQPSDELTQALDANIGGIFLSGFAKRPDAEYIFLCPIRLINDTTLELAVEKELGHALGLKTIPQDTPAIMNSSFNPKVKCPTIYDMQQLCQLLVCDIEEVNHCKI